MKSIGPDGLNLLQDLKPPKSLYIEVNCLKSVYKMNSWSSEVWSSFLTTCSVLSVGKTVQNQRQNILQSVLGFVQMVHVNITIKVNSGEIFMLSACTKEREECSLEKWPVFSFSSKRIFDYLTKLYSVTNQVFHIR